MSKITTNTKQIDGTRQVRVVLTGWFDGTDGQESQVIKIDTWGLRGALSTAANGTQLLAGNGNPRSSYNVSVNRILYSMSAGGLINLAWQGSTNTPFITLAGSGSYDPARGTDLVINPEAFNGAGAPGHTGNIVLTTLGFGVNTEYSIVLDMKKDPKAFNQGQIERPKDFNIIVATGNNA